MKEIEEPKVPVNEVWDNPFSQETNAQNLLRFITDHHCKEAEEFYEGLLEGHDDLIHKPEPGYSDRTILLPRDVSPEFFATGWKKRVMQWVERKKKAVDRLLDLDADKAASLLGNFCGYIVDFHIRKGLINKRPECRSLIEQEVTKLADKMRLSGNILVRRLQEGRLQRQITTQKGHPDVIAEHKYYFDLKTLLRE